MQLSQILRDLDDLDDVELAALASEATAALASRLRGAPAETPSAVRRRLAAPTTVLGLGLAYVASELARHLPGPDCLDLQQIAMPPASVGQPS